MKKTTIASALVALCALIAGCNKSSVTISGRLLGLNGRSVCLEEIAGGRARIIDSVQLADDGSYRLSIDGVEAAPSLYNLVYNGERAPLLVRGGERITVNSIGSLLRNYTVSGSEESELLREFNREYLQGLENLNSILERYAGDSNNENMLREYSEAYREAKRAQLKFIIEHKDRIAAVYALYQRFPGESNLFSPDGDIIYYRTVADAVAERYPQSPFLPTLRTEIANMDARRTLMSQIRETNFPDIELPDMYGNNIRLSSFDGKVILLSFWSAGVAGANVLNAELKEIYAEYADKGFEIYQVCIDTPKAAWIEAVQEQRLPWTSVCDLRSASAALYNVRTLPANFLIDGNGNIAGKNIYGDELRKQLSKLL